MSAFRVASEAALDLARARHDAILSDDFDRYAELSGALELACAALDADSGEGEDRAVLDEIAALETASLRVLQAQAGEISGRLGELASQARTHRAYARSERFSVNGL